MEIGIDYRLFWELNPEKMRPFTTAFINKNKHEQNKINLICWLTGIYSTQAIAACLGTNNNYPSAPMSLNDSDEDTNKRAETEAQKFEAFAIAFNHEFNKRQSKKKTNENTV